MATPAPPKINSNKPASNVSASGNPHSIIQKSPLPSNTQTVETRKTQTPPAKRKKIDEEVVDTDATGATAAGGMSLGTMAAAGGAVVVVAAAAGGGGGGGDTPTSTSTSPPGVTNTVVKVSDGYISGAQIYIDQDGDGVANAGEALAGVITDAEGDFLLPSNAPAGAIIAIGGFNVDTGLANTMPLKAPAGSTVITPLTTLVQEYIETNGGSVAQANTAVLTALGLDANINLTTYDAIAELGDTTNNQAALDTALAVQKAAVQIATIVSMAANAPANGTTSDAAAAAVIDNLVSTITNAAATATPVISLTDAATLTAILTNTGTTTTSAEIDTATTSIGNATTLGAIAEGQALASNTSTEFSVSENSTEVGPVIATGFANNASLTYNITGGLDSAEFTISNTGILSFKSAPNFEVPTDAGINNIYIATVQVSDGTNTQSKTIVVTVTNDNDPHTGTVTITGTPTENQTLTANNTLADVDGLGTLSYQWKANNVNVGANQNTYTLGDAEVGKAMTVTVSYTDGQGFSESATSLATAAVAGVNSAPVIGGMGGTLAYTENQAATFIDTAVTVTDIDSPDFNGGSLTVSFTTTGTAADQLTILNEGIGANQIGVIGSTITFANQTIGTFTGGANGSNLVVTFTTTNATQAAVDRLIERIAYSNNSEAPSTTNRTVTYTLIDGDGTLNSGADTAVATATITVTSVNDAPTLIATAANPTFTEGAGLAQGTAVSVFSGTAISTIEAGQSITSSTFTVSGLIDGSNEKVTINGTQLSLTDGITGSTVIGGITVTYNVSLIASTATVSLTSSGVSTANAQTLLNSIQYQNTNVNTPTAGNRVFTLTQIKDSGGLVNSGADTTTINIQSTVTVTPVNDTPTGAPTISGAPIKGQVLTANTDTINDPDGLGNGTFTYQWLRGTAVILQATGATYKLVDADVGQTIRVRVTYVDGGGTTETPTSSPTVAIINSVKFLGETSYDLSGFAVSNAGDVNGDGFGDIIIGALGAGSVNLNQFDDPNSANGASYVVFGSASGFANLNLNTLTNAQGFKLTGVAAGDKAGTSVSNAGDINGDGIGDMIVGASGVSSSTGASYVVFGKAAGNAFANINLSTLNGGASGGFKITGEANSQSGFSVSNAGDVNGDGLADLIIGARNADTAAGAAYVVFGKVGGFTDINLGTLGTAGFKISGGDTQDGVGTSVSGAGDVNGDGFDDLIIGAPGIDRAQGASEVGDAFVVFGQAGITNFGLATLTAAGNANGNLGFKLSGVAQQDYTGVSVSSAGDINGDGFADLIVGAERASNFANAGVTYIVFGQAAGITGGNFDLATLSGGNGFKISGEVISRSGHSVSSAGDVNGDGFDDLIIGAPKAAARLNVPVQGSTTPANLYDGASYIVFGKASGFAANLDLTTLNGTNGFKLFAENTADEFGTSVSSAGDVNGDGFDDLIVGAPLADLVPVPFVDPIAPANPAETLSGASYVIYGGNFTGAAIRSGTSTGTSAAETFVGGLGNDTMTGGGGADAFQGGAGDDTIVIADLSFLRVDGGSGSDTLSLSGITNMHLILADYDNKIADVERINLSDGNHDLTVTALTLLGLSDTSNTLIVNRDSVESVVTATGFTQGANVANLGDNIIYLSYTSGQASLYVQVI